MVLDIFLLLYLLFNLVQTVRVWIAGYPRTWVAIIWMLTEVTLITLLCLRDVPEITKIFP